ncbi:MAG: hypothetical protein JWN04_6911 [Myxococcaceae bacterium]|nr:hypothetical protein [Myxococcaceae bacterium]
MTSNDILKTGAGTRRRFRRMDGCFNALLLAYCAVNGAACAGGVGSTADGPGSTGAGDAQADTQLSADAGSSSDAAPFNDGPDANGTLPDAGSSSPSSMTDPGAPDAAPITPPRSTTASVEDFFRQLPTWASTHPLQDEKDSASGPANSTASVLPDSNALSGQQKYSCTVTPYTLKSQPDKIVTFNPDSSKLWLGSILQGNGYVNGLGSLKELPIRERAPLRLFIDALGPSVTATIASPDAASVHQGIGTLVQQLKDAHVAVGSNVSFSEATNHSFEQSVLSMGFSVNYMGADVKATLNTTTKADQHSVTASFVQRAFTVSIVSPQSPAALFSPALTVAELNEQAQLDRIGPNNLPVYVSSIAYGRLLLATITSTEDVDKIVATLNVSYKAGSAGGSLDLTVDQQKLLEESQIQVVAIGGDESNAEALIRSGKLADYFETTADLSTYVPISYQVDNLGDGSAAKFTETTNYNLTECAPVPNTAIDVGDVAKLVITRAIANNGGCWDFLYKKTDLAGQLSIDGATVWNDSKDDNKVHLDPHSWYDFTNVELPAPAADPNRKPYNPAPGPGEREFYDASGGSFHIEGLLKDQQNTGDWPTNTVDRQETYPFVYGTKVIPGNSQHCNIDLEYTITKSHDIYNYVP